MPHCGGIVVTNAQARITSIGPSATTVHGYTIIKC